MLEKVELGESFANDEAAVHLFKYQFRPASIASQKVALLQHDPKSSKFHLDFSECCFSAVPVAKKGECCLIWNEERQVWVLERVGAVFTWQHDRQRKSAFKDSIVHDVDIRDEMDNLLDDALHQ